MKTKVLYTIINILSLLSGIATACLVAVIIANIVGAIQRSKSAEIGRLFSSVLPNLFGFVVVTIILYAIWDIGTRLIRIEEGQQSMLREMRNKQDSVA